MYQNVNLYMDNVLYSKQSYNHDLLAATLTYAFFHKQIQKKDSFKRRIVSKEG